MTENDLNIHDGYTIALELHAETILLCATPEAPFLPTAELRLTPAQAVELARRLLNAASEYGPRRICTCTSTQTVGNCPRHDAP